MAIVEVIAALVTPLVAEAAAAIQKRFASDRPDYQMSLGDTLAAVKTHLQYADRWVREVRIADLPGPKTLRDIFVELDLNVTPRRQRLDTEHTRTFALTSLATRSGYSVILGDPGAGKTTSLKRLCQIALDSVAQNKSQRMILLIVLRDLGEGESLADRILIELGVGLVFSLNVKPAVQLETKRRIAVDLLGTLPAFLFIDGLDEVSHTMRSQVEEDLRSILARAENAGMVLTTRSADYQFNLPNCHVFELEGLSKTQIEEFAQKWLVRHEEAIDFLKELKNSPYADTVVRPLTLSHLCAIYSRTGHIPDKPKTVYRKIVYLLLKEWDEQKSVRRTSEYGRFEPDRKQEFLEHLAFHMTRVWQVTKFGHEQLSEAYEALASAHGLPKNQAIAVAREIESHTGLILQSGYEQYEFAHKSLQEYLAAEYIVKYPDMPTDSVLLSKMPNELAIAVALSSAPSVFLSKLLTAVFSQLDGGPLNDKEGVLPAAQTFFYRLNQERPSFEYSQRLSIGLLLFGETLRTAQMAIGDRRRMSMESERKSSYRDRETEILGVRQRALDSVLESLTLLSKHDVVAELLSHARSYYDTIRTQADIVLRRRATSSDVEDREIPDSFPESLTLSLTLGSAWGFLAKPSS